MCREYPPLRVAIQDETPNCLMIVRGREFEKKEKKKKEKKKRKKEGGRERERARDKFCMSQPPRRPSGLID